MPTRSAFSSGVFLKLRRRIRFFSPYKNSIFVLFVLGFLSSLFFLAGPYLSRLYIDTSFLKRDLPQFIRLSIVGIVLFLFSTLSGTAEDIIKNRTLIKIKLGLAHTFIRKLYAHDLAYLQSKSVGETIYRISNVETVARFIGEEIPRVLVDSCRLCIILGITLFMDFRLTIALVFLSPLFLIRGLYLRKKTQPIFSEIWKSNARLTKRLQESLSKMQIIKALRLELFQRHAYIRLLIENIRLTIKGFRWFIINSLSTTFLAKAVYGLISLFGGWFIIKGELTLGRYTAVMLYVAQAGTLLSSLSHRFEYFVQQGVTLDKFFEVIDSRPRIVDAPGAVRLGPFKKEIVSCDVAFGYEPGKQVFSRLSVSFPAGKWVGIVGPSGCGKTTLVNLILRLYEPQAGTITIDGLEVRQAKLDSLRERIAAACQEPLLFDFSIRENICLGLMHVSEGELEEVISIIQAGEFIRQLPDGPDTAIGENAHCLSQGYKQRLALARAVIRKPDILILDEATSSIDSATETKILQALKTKRSGQTTIVISHRLSTIKNADAIYFFNPRGEIETGPHEGLLAKSPDYKGFFQDQL